MSILFCFPIAHRQGRFAADLIVLNANVRTLDKSLPSAEAVAVFGNRIVAVGANAEMRSLVGPRTRVIDGRGHLLLPAFNDAHVHFMSGGFQLSSVDLRTSNTPDEFARRIKEYAERLKAGSWITGGDWDHERWPGAPLPSRALIDAITPRNPVFVSRLDGHMALANSLALRLAGVTRTTPDPPGGVVVRDQNGEPTGVLKDAAMAMVYKIMPGPSDEEKIAAARAASDYAARLGVGSVQDMSAGADVAIYQTLRQRGELKTRIYAASPLSDWKRLAEPGLRAPFGSDMLRVGSLKGFADGSLGSTTALFFEPYSDVPGYYGLASDEMVPDGVMLERVRQADRRGLQVLIHAIGDRANSEILSIYDRVSRENGERDRRFRIEHAQHLRAKDITRFACLHVIASVQPYHAIDDGRWAEKRVGRQRAQTSYAFRSLMESGAQVAFGTDWTVAPLDPLLTIYAAVTRRTLDGRHPDGWIPEQKIGVEEAVRAYTVGSAFAEFTENSKGTISAGKLADLVLLNQDIFTIDPATIKDARVLLTIVDGRVVFEEAKAF